MNRDCKVDELCVYGYISFGIMWKKNEGKWEQKRSN